LYQACSWPAWNRAVLWERILADELAGAFDAYDIEPLPVDDPLRTEEFAVPRGGAPTAGVSPA
jgi:hypothetical protein